MIWLQYDDPNMDNGFEFLKFTYPDDEYPKALAHYAELKKKWKRTRILLEDNYDPRDWVIVQNDA